MPSLHFSFPAGPVATRREKERRPPNRSEGATLRRDNQAAVESELNVAQFGVGTE